jgi:hypothetical protein
MGSKLRKRFNQITEVKRTAAKTLQPVNAELAAELEEIGRSHMSTCITIIYTIILNINTNDAYTHDIYTADELQETHEKFVKMAQVPHMYV